MEKYALVKDGVVYNIAIWDEVTIFNTPGFEKVKVNGRSVNIDDLYIDGEFVAPAPAEE